MKRNWKKDRMTIKGKYSSYLYVGIACILFLFTGCDNSQSSKKETTLKEKAEYYCPMHPEIHQDHPGKCPKPECAGMELVLKENQEYLEAALKPVSSNVLSKITLVNPQYKKLPLVTEALGYIDYDNYSKYDISSRYSGRIDNLYIKYNYQPIKKGDPVFEIYSADIVNAQENLIYLLKNNPSEKDLIDAARQKLILLQLTDAQIKEIETTKKVRNTITVYSKYDGHVHEMMDSKMSKEMNDYSKSPLVSMREGMYVERGKVLFNVVNPYKAVIMLKIKPADIGKIHLGEKVDFTVNDNTNMEMSGKIDFIEPVFNPNSKSMMVRVNLDNEGHRHKIGSLVNAKIISDSLETMWVPQKAVVDLGKNNIVWVWKGDAFKAVKVETGVRVNGWVEITDGLTETDKIASEAHFLSDSESFIKVNDNE
jgi:Cu(I)/Ag(I) efflux system membrane fusion protein